jgi:hypothetical protein
MTILVRVAVITILALACTACTSEQLQRFSEGMRKSQNGDLGNAVPGYRDAQEQQAQTQLMKAHTEAMQQWTQCMQTVGDANQCGPAPAAPNLPSAPRHIDQTCLQDCMYNKGYADGLCKDRCSY